MSASGLEAESDSDGDWEEVLIPEQEKNLEITISARSKQDKKASSERLLRTNCHKLHTLALLTNARVRNKWINDPLLHARLLSLTPLSLQTAFAMIHKSRVPEQHKRGRMFETAMGHLVFWWAQTFFYVTFDGHLRNRTFDAVQKAVELLEVPDATEAWDVELLQEVLGDKGELIRGPKSLMKHALMQKGSRDTSAQLFTALCRGLGIPARLVKNYHKAKRDAQTSDATRDVKGKGKAKADSGIFVGDGQRLDGGSVPEKSEKAKGKEKAKPVIKLRKSKPQGNVLGSSRSSPSTSASQTDPTTTPPVFWTEVFSRPDGRWFPVDPVRGTVNQTHAFDPSYAYAYGGPMQTISTIANPNSAYARPSAGAQPPPNARNVTRALTDNRMLYVLAFEDDGYARDVTPRYARQYAAKVAKIQGGTKRGGREAWWDLVVESVKRPYRLHRDDVEDAELDVAQLHEGMPTTVGGFKDHPMYVLVRHLTQTQTIHPPPPQTRELGKFRGEPRKIGCAVRGRQVKEGEQPLKWVKMRASTIGRMREVEVLREGLRIAGEHAETAAAANDGTDNPGSSSAVKVSQNFEKEVMQGLYALSQTEVFVPDPVVDGKIPKNNFGNIDLYVPSMLPAGAAHLPFKNIAKIARKLGFDFAEAVTGFEFKSRRANPVMQGIVIAAENEEAVLEAYWEAQNDAAEKAQAKKREQVLKRWTRLIHGLRIRHSLQEEYKDRQPAVGENGEDVEVTPGLAGGGFVTGADDVVQAYQLPKYQHVNLPVQESSSRDSAGPPGATSDSEAVAGPFEFETMDVDSDPGIEDVQPSAPRPNLRDTLSGEDVEDVDMPLDPIAPAPTAKKTRRAKPSREPKAKAGPPAARRRRVSSRKRRKKGTDSDSGSEEGVEPSPAKRAKVSKGAAPAPAPAPAAETTGRSLRPRRTKTQTELEKEAEQERAFRRAVAK
ncbi:hypothetical protein MSAN_01776500 [Mycena sanguinolenta]|uniref:Rad4-domain-containing protein n=1 Tax=Mycena sanguinolenta TaxID=230812 RepID=A0A8H6XXK6_9AGAR|nr:hypothetical protein MSAN_01776500 [Mycena sanguinolenta]